MGDIKRDWFDPARLFDEGYPDGLTSALRAMPKLRRTIVDEVVGLSPRRALEVGPGDVPIIAGVWSPIFVDLAPRFLGDQIGRAARADVRALPFADSAFDVVVAADVLTHIHPEERPIALGEMARVAKAIVLFNPEPGTHQVETSQVPTQPIVDWMQARGLLVRVRQFVAQIPGFEKFDVDGQYSMALIRATRAG
jgi:SAM-dependent methyltransferase